MNNNKKIHIKSLIIFIIIIVLIVVGISITMSRYRSGAKTVLDVDVAFYVVKDNYVQEGNIFLKDLYPREDPPFEYAFTVSNTDGTNTAETAIEYTVEMEITTNLPLQFSIYRQENEEDEVELTSADDIENYVTLDDAGDSYIRKIKIKSGNFTFEETKTDTYRIEVVFPEEYAEYEEYEGMIDNINLRLKAKQKID